jgi:hypothetical protein
MNRGIIGATVYAYKHKDYGDVFLSLEYSSTHAYLDVVETPYEAIYSYQSHMSKFDEMVAALQEEYVYITLSKEYTDQDGYTGSIKKSVALQIKDFVKVAFEANYNQAVGD